MQHDTIIWNVISPHNGGFCSFRRALPHNRTKFCKHPFNVLGLCHPDACPLANSRYATVREHKGEVFLCIKTIERAHTPAKHWEKIRLSKDYKVALRQINEHLTWWPTFYVHNCKLRLTKIHQYLIRSRRLELGVQPKLTRVWRPYERQQKTREAKAEIAAKITNVVREELLERLHEGVYEGIYNFPLKQYNDILDKEGVEDNEEEVESEAEQMDAVKEDAAVTKSKSKVQPQKVQQFVADFDLTDTEDMEDMAHRIEYEYETEGLLEAMPAAGGSAATGARMTSSSSSSSSSALKMKRKKSAEKETDASEEPTEKKMSESELRDSLRDLMKSFTMPATEESSSPKKRKGKGASIAAKRAKAKARKGSSKLSPRFRGKFSVKSKKASK